MTATWSSRARPLILLAALTAGAALLRFALAARVPLVEDEAYYWLWSRHLSWGYPDHPPMIAALIALATAVAGDSPLAIRTITGLLASAIPPLVYLTGRDLVDASSGVRGAVIVSVLPIVALGTALAFPDTPLGFLWMLGLWTGWRALREGGWWWVATGAAVGLALLTKLTAVFLVLGLAGMLITGGGWRRAPRDPGFYAGAAVAAMMVAPFILWNATHHWWTIRSTLESPAWIQPRSLPENLLLYAAGQIGYHGPVAFLMVAAMVAATRRRSESWSYLLWMSAPLFLATLVSAAWARAKPHWTSPAYFSAAIALAALWSARTGWHRPSVAGVGPTALLTIVLAAAALLPLRGVDLTSSFGRWDAAARAAARRAEELHAAGRPAFILTDGYQSASQIAYHLRERIVVTPLRAAFTLWSPPELSGHDAVYVETDGYWRSRIQDHCAALTRRESVMVSPVLAATLYVCTEFSVPP